MDVKDHLSLHELERIERAETEAWRAKRLRIVILAINGYTAPAVAMSLGLSRRICQRWLNRYNSEGLAGLEDRRGGQAAPLLTAEQEVHFRQRLAAGPTPADQVCSLRGVDLRRILADEFNTLRSLASVYNLLHRLKYSYLCPRPRHRRANPEAQAVFKQTLHARLSEIALAHPDQQLRIFFQDEARFGQHGTTTRVWAPKGSRPTAVRQTEYQYLWVLGAVCPQTGQGEGLISPRLNTAVVNLFLEQFSASLSPLDHAVMIWDGAGFHTSKQLRVPQNITLLRLPAYSPELNPIENLWHYLKSHFWSNRAYQDYEALEQAAVDAWQIAALNPELMKTVCNAPYVKSATSS